MAESLFPGEPPVSLDEVRAWLRLGTPADDAVIERLIDAATTSRASRPSPSIRPSPTSHCPARAIPATA